MSDKPQDEVAGTLRVPSAPACRHLRSKGMYVTGKLDPSEDYSGMSDGNCWCNLTQNVIGPDDGLVDRPECRAGRTCYVPLI